MAQLLFEAGFNVTSHYGKSDSPNDLKRSKSWHKAWNPSRKFSLSTVQEIRYSELSSERVQRNLQEARPSTTAPSSPIPTVPHGASKDVIPPHKDPNRGEGERFTGCPVTQEFRQAKAHHPVLASTGCTKEFCQAGRAVHIDEPRIGENRAIAVVEQEAEGFLRELYRENFFDTEEAFTDRLNDVLAQIRAGAGGGKVRATHQRGILGGNWLQTSAELEFGIRRAWRNARKCIMRSHCEELK
ncbi:MAG: hypothetical protein Q9188_002024 [Gyalolechia gomerana]